MLIKIPASPARPSTCPAPFVDVVFIPEAADQPRRAEPRQAREVRVLGVLLWAPAPESARW